MDEPPIVAVATAPGTGAIALLRLSGAGSATVVDRVFRGRCPSAQAPARRVIRGRIVDEDDRVLDDVLLTRFQPPASYTGEEVVEIACHGGGLVTASILRLLLQAGARMAEPGEFTLRAFMNGKLDLTQAEAVMDLISAKTPLALRAAGEQLEGRLGAEITRLRGVILQAVAHLEAWIDFPEEGLGEEVVAGLLETIEEAQRQVQRLLSTAEEGRILREGIRLAICGAPNAGKSSLLNALLGMDRAIVSEQPGTTRDTIEEVVNVRGFPFRMIDTAGLREGADALERAGIARTHRALDAAEIILEVVDATTGERVDLGAEAEGKPRVVVFNKCDVPSAQMPGEGAAVAISCHTGQGMEVLLDCLLAAVRSPEGLLPGEGRDSAAAINARHQSCLWRAADALVRASDALCAGVEPELTAIDLRVALEAIGEVTGQADAEEILGEIFTRFCIGK